MRKNINTYHPFRLILQLVVVLLFSNISNAHNLFETNVLSLDSFTEINTISKTTNDFAKKTGEIKHANHSIFGETEIEEYSEQDQEEEEEGKTDRYPGISIFNKHNIALAALIANNANYQTFTLQENQQYLLYCRLKIFS